MAAKGKNGRKTSPSKKKPVPFPFRVGCVDTGSNAIRFLIAEFKGPDDFETVAYERVPVRLGHQVFLTGKLAPNAMDGAVEAFVSFRSRMKDMELAAFRAVATSAVREARNGGELVDRVKKEAEIELEMISGSEEARLVHIAVGSRVDLTGGQWILTDLGGGSVEVSLVDDMGMLWSESHTMGSVRLLEELSRADSEPKGFRALLSDYVSTLRIPSPAQYWSPAGFVATGGNIEALADLAGTPRDARGVASLSVEDLNSAIDLLSGLSFTQRMTQLGLREDRADVILPAAIVYHHLAGLASSQSILVPGVGVKEGILLDLAEDVVSHTTHEARREQQLAKAATSLGRRFMFDEAHGLHVSRIALSLFDQLQELHGLAETDRLLLLAAAILHDIGTFVSRKGHHKHSLYLVSRSELPGLSPMEMLMVANIGRYHRKNIPRNRHPEFMRLSETDRERTRALSAILRVADALDRAHLQHVETVGVEVGKREVSLRLRGEGDLLLERWALSRKKNLFQRTFRRVVKIAV
jgi:exopolyphosphatase/guanosine-5'-triphosphate,3'-diphosphate pyrophosphatase